MFTNGMSLRGPPFFCHRRDIAILSSGSKPVNGFGLRSPLSRDAPRYARIRRFLYIACSEYLFTSMKADIGKPIAAMEPIAARIIQPENLLSTIIAWRSRIRARTSAVIRAATSIAASASVAEDEYDCDRAQDWQQFREASADDVSRATSYRGLTSVKPLQPTMVVTARGERAAQCPSLSPEARRNQSDRSEQRDGPERGPSERRYQHPRAHPRPVLPILVVGPEGGESGKDGSGDQQRR